jgi:hypothetical protein
VSDENQFLRYAVPGIATGLIFAMALLASVPTAILNWLSAGVAKDGAAPLLDTAALLLSGFLASGGLGFILAQVYFALPSVFNTADHRAAVGVHTPAHPGWDLPADSRTRLKAHRQARFAWAMYVAERHRDVEALTASSSRRMAAIGTTLAGTVLAGVLWLVVLSSGRLGTPSAAGWFGGGAVILVTGLLLWRTWHKIRKDLEEVVFAGLANSRRDASEPLQHKARRHSVRAVQPGKGRSRRER